MTTTPAPIRVEVLRSDPSATHEFDVSYTGPMTILDVLVAVQTFLDPTLAFRYSCRSARCGTCTLLSDGTPVLACHAAVRPGQQLRLAPLGGMPVVRDLIVDITPFTRAWSRVASFLTPGVKKASPRFTDEESLAMLDDARECIACAACFTACPVAAADGAFVGPAALAHASAHVIDDGFDARVVAPRLRSSEGVSGCHSVGACSAVCPRGVDPARAIRRLRHAVAGVDS